jgi:hypothetical protein
MGMAFRIHFRHLFLESGACYPDWRAPKAWFASTGPEKVADSLRDAIF